ncbi:cGMP phosphodiesterase [Fimicolochytrium jonesii]|uniref:cGMP phosphodiesterase n=1 Tax=Fimicolochytrium jonesii TaxID=1396493 RepID=UPI0022FE5195|nr:cGMP phosphodiesterase [Fimicolochytrium jonesii]KAI8817941.1 cGMP phosphodiesterase [Fimicolochytrium jonesii]
MADGQTTASSRFIVSRILSRIQHNLNGLVFRKFRKPQSTGSKRTSKITPIMSSQHDERVVHLRIKVSHASTSPASPTQESEQAVVITPSASPDEVRAVLLAAADVSPAQAKGAVLKVRGADGTILPVGAKWMRDASEGGKLSVEVIVMTAEDPSTSLSVAPSPTDLKAIHETIAALRAQLDSVSLLQKNALTNNRTPRRAVKRVTRIDPRCESEPLYQFTEDTKKMLKTPTFDPWDWEDNEMMALLEFMFFDLGLVKEFNMEVPILKRFLRSVRDGYQSNYFHNFRHCFCVAHMAYAILYTTGVVEKLQPVDKLVLLTACIGHDLDHPGYNNAYQINAHTDLAIIYNDQSPLEMHHAAVLFTILKDPATNILSTLPPALLKDVRKNIIRCILATDMAQHGPILAAFKKHADEGFSYDDPEQKSLLLQVITKCADVSNEVRPPEVADPWVDCLLEEFFEQADREKKEGLPFAPFMDREKVTKASAQVGFIGFVLVPLYELAAKVLPNMEPIINPVKEALATYKKLLEEEKAAAVKSAATPAPVASTPAKA